MSSESIPVAGSGGGAPGESREPAAVPDHAASGADLVITSSDEALPETTGARIKYHCDQNGLSHRQLASRMGQSYSWLVRVFRNDFDWLRELDDGLHHPDPRPAERPTLWRLAQELGVDVTVLLGRPLRHGTAPLAPDDPCELVPSLPPGQVPAGDLAAPLLAADPMPTREQIAPGPVAAAPLATTPGSLQSSPPHPGGSLAAIRRWGADRGAGRLRRAWVGAAAVGACRQLALKIGAPKMALAAAAGLAAATGVVGDRGPVPDMPVHRAPAPTPHGQTGNLALGPLEIAAPASGSPLAPGSTLRAASKAPPPAPALAPPDRVPVPPPVAAMPVRPRVVRAAARVQPAGPVAALSASSIDFGWVPVGSSVARTVTLTNTGDSPLHVSRTTLFAGGEVSATRDTCGGSSLSPGQRCSVTLVYHPVKQGMLTYIAQLGFVDDAPGVGGGQVVKLEGATT